MNSFDNIVFSVDCETVSDDLIRKAIRICTSLECRVVIADTIQEFSWLTRMTLANHDEILAVLEKDKQAALEKVVSEFSEAGVDATGILLHGPTSDAVARYCEENPIDLILRLNKGTHSKERGQLGRTSKRLLRKCSLPIWLMHRQTRPVSENIVACIDTESQEPEDLDLADRIIQTAEYLKGRGHGLISVVHAWELWNEKMVASRISPEEFKQWKASCEATESERFNDFLKRHGRSVEDHDVFLLEGDPSVAVPEFVNRVSADVVVMGTVGRSGVTGMVMGNTAERIFDAVECDVLALKRNPSN